jgi:hypothetical protein
MNEDTMKAYIQPSKFKSDIDPVHSIQIPTAESIRVLSKDVDLNTDEGARLEFDSWEDMKEYMHKMNEEKSLLITDGYSLEALK